MKFWSKQIFVYCCSIWIGMHTSSSDLYSYIWDDRFLIWALQQMPKWLTLRNWESPVWLQSGKRFTKYIKTPLTEQTVFWNLVSKQKAPSADASNCCDGFKLLLPGRCVCVRACVYARVHVCTHASEETGSRDWFLTTAVILLSNSVKTSSWYHREIFQYYARADMNPLSWLALLEMLLFPTIQMRKHVTCFVLNRRSLLTPRFYLLSVWSWTINYNFVSLSFLI